MNKTGIWLILGAVSLAGGAAAAATPAQDASYGAGVSATAGSRGYHRLGADADGLWRSGDYDPYAWAELSADNFVNQASLGGGVWKDLDAGLRVKGGAGFSAGRVKDPDSSRGAFLFETGVEKDLETPTLGAEYRLTAGSLSPPGSLRGAQAALPARARGRGDPGGPGPSTSFTYNELSGYARIPVGAPTLGLRLTAGFPSYGRSIISETASLKIPLTKPLSLTPAVTVEEATTTEIYFSLSLRAWFS